MSQLGCHRGTRHPRALGASDARLRWLLIAICSTACVTPPSARPPPLDDFPLLAGQKDVPVGDPSHGCAAPGETLTDCVDAEVPVPGVPPTTLRACAFVPPAAKDQRRIALLQKGRILACLVMTDLERTPDDQLYRLDPKFAATGLLVFTHHGYASDLDRLEILQVGDGAVTTAFRGHWLNFLRFDDLDGDGVPELLGTENASQSLQCDYIPTAVFALKRGRYVRDDAAMERLAKANQEPWWGPEPLINGDDNAKHPFMVDCHEKLRLMMETPDQE